MAAPNSAPPASPRRSRHVRAFVRALGATFALLVIVAVALLALLSTEPGLEWFAGELVARSGGALEIDGASGALVDTVRARRIAWHGADSRVVATDVALTWRPWALFSRSIEVHGLGARTLEIELSPSDKALALPSTLELPVKVAIERVAVGTLLWHVGANAGTIEGLEFGYTGDASGHRVSDLKLVTLGGTFTGEATLGAHAPFPLEARIHLAADATLRNARADFVATGTLTAVTVDATAVAGEGRATARVALAPLAVVPLLSVAVDARDVDLAAWDPVLPSTRIAGTIDAKPVSGGLAGTLDFQNSLTGTFDVDRVPIRALAAQFAWTRDTIALDALNAEIDSGGRATGRGHATLGAAPPSGNLHLDVRDVDLRRLFPRLVATRLSGTTDINLDPTERTVAGTLADRGIAGGMSLEFAMAIDDRAAVVKRLRARAGPGEALATGRVEFGGRRAFAFDATATRLDPSRFGAYPAGAIDATLKATGTLAPTWRVDGSIALGPGSKLAGIALGGTARGSAEPGRVRDAAIDLKAGHATLVANGSLGAAGDRMTIAFDARELAELVPILPPVVPRTLAGELHVKAEASGTPPAAGLDVAANGARLKLGGGLSAATLDVHAKIAPSASRHLDLATRTLALDVGATDLRTPSGDVVGGRATASGTLAAHDITLALDGGELGLDATAHGGVSGDPASDAVTALAWNGTIESFSGRGLWALKLASPATLSLAHHKARLGEAHFTVADGSVDVGEFAWDDGRIATRGRFAAVPLATVARLAGRPLPVRSTLTFGGEWSVAATPRLNGTVNVHREQGDLWLVRERDTGPSDAAAGITILEATARAHDDAIDATLQYRAARGGSIDATVALGVAPDAPPGRPSPRAPLVLTLVADLPSLAVLQPWVGTTAVVDGRLHADLAAHGTLANAPISGTVAGTDLTVDAPQYGLHFRQGRLNARLADRRVTLDELAFTAGDGEFRATGTLAAPTEAADTSAAHVAWHAEKFRVFNRPDFNLVVSGGGEMVLASGKVTLTGSLRADEGRFVYEFDPMATLGDDVVVKGWDRTPDAARTADVPLAIDVNLDFGDKLTFSGRGLEAGLRGEVRVRNGPNGFTGRGQLYTVNGTYFAYGQKLAIDPGRLIFDGPLDNPALDIIALRRNLQVEAGVRVTGTVRVPIITLTSNPPVPDSEKLAWLVLGQSLATSSNADMAALQAASAALLGPNSKPVGMSIAQSIGLDDISFKSATATSRNGSATTPSATGQVVSIGKRLNDRLTVAWEQGLTVATNALRVEYALSNTLSVRAEAGTVSGVGLYYRRNFE
jgi:translocation and assembly module TamB